LNKFLALSLILYPFVLILFEKFYFSSTLITKREVWVSSLFGLTKFLDWILKAYIVLLLVNFVAPFEIFSFSNMPVPKILSIILSFLFIDFFSYFSHWSFHKIQFLWSLHRLHHSDKSVDTITTFFHHPLERVADFFINVTIFVLFDIPVPVILFYGLIASLHAPLTHFKILLPEKLNKILSYLIVTPNFHRIHHSLDMKEGNSNFGIIFPFWDKLFGTYVSKTSAQMRVMKLGISLRESPAGNSLKEYLMNPFISRQEKS
jgi:hypothetical protein